MNLISHIISPLCLLSTCMSQITSTLTPSFPPFIHLFIHSSDSLDEPVRAPLAVFTPLEDVEKDEILSLAKTEKSPEITGINQSSPSMHHACSSAFLPDNRAAQPDTDLYYGEVDDTSCLKTELDSE